MGSNGKKKTTMAKIMRENRLRERRMIKQAKKDARKLASLDGSGQPGDAPSGEALDPTIGELPPLAHEQAVAEPATDEPATDEPATDEPATDEPATDEPATDEPVLAEPVVELLSDA